MVTAPNYPVRRPRTGAVLVCSAHGLGAVRFSGTPRLPHSGEAAGTTGGRETRATSVNLDVPRRIKWTAYAIPLCALPSGLWRITLVTGWPDWYAGHD